MKWKQLIEKTNKKLEKLQFSSPVAHTYNPLSYSFKMALDYSEKFGSEKVKAVFLGMNPGPFGMVQTGVPFGEIAAVRDFLKIPDQTGRPYSQHPKRSVEGFECKRSEVSGRRLWEFMKDRFGDCSYMKGRVFIANYCPLAFLSERGSNITPDKLKKSERESLFEICDELILETFKMLDPEYLIGIGNFAFERLTMLNPSEKTLLKIPHPSPANPRANKFWFEDTSEILDGLGLY
ncbi:MAG: single-stranded DNA-binding protein [Deltaproteobacteria bacterium]|nr:single-stranded DNA-binding protein [Deltaproteobacteria bacterium]